MTSPAQAAPARIGAPQPAARHHHSQGRPRQAGPVTRDRGRARIRAHAASVVLLAVVLVPIAVVHATGMSKYPAHHDDEGTYVAQAEVFQDDFRLSHYTYWYDHPPTGWITLAAYAAVTGLTERADNAVAGGREALLVAHLLSCALLYLLCRRLGIARGWAVLALALFSFSPLAIEYHRMVFLDNLAMPWLLGSFVLALTPERRLSAYAGSAVCFALAVLTKETTLLALPALVYQMWQNTDEANRRYAWTVFGALLVLTGLLFPLYALLRGELLPGHDHVSLWEAILFHLVERDPVEPLGIISGWLRSDQLLLLLGATAAIPAALQRRLRPYIVFATVHVAMMFRPGGYLPEPYVIVLLFPAALLVAGVLDGLWHWHLIHGRHIDRRPRVRVLDRVPAGLAAAAMGVLVVAAAAEWSPGGAMAMHADDDMARRQAHQWVRQHVSTDQRLLIESTLWVDLVRDGFPEDKVIWFYKLDLDPEIQEFLPGGWQEFDYIVGTRIIRDMAGHLELEEVQRAIDNSELVGAWGEGHTRVEIRQVLPERNPATPSPVRDPWQVMAGAGG